VVDGDTVMLTRLGSSRLIGVDTPEVYGGAECYGREASAFARRVLRPGTRTHYVKGVDPRDRYGRTLVYLWLEDGRSFNAMLVEGGYATTLTIRPNDRYAPRLGLLAREARRAGRGLWSPATCRGSHRR
jgi:micrococcal nuclease